MLRSWGLVLTAAVLIGPAAQAQTSWAQKMVSDTSIDFGVIATGAEAVKRVKVTNVFDQPVRISNVRTTCGCSAATPETNQIAPGEHTFVEVKMNTRKFRRRKDSNLIIQFSAPQFAEVRIPITAYIRSDVVFDPGMVRFDNVDYGNAANRTVKIAYAGRSDWKIVDVKVSDDNMKATLQENNRGNGRVDYDLTVQLSSGATAGRIRELITLVTDDQANPYVPLMVEGAVIPDITVTPAVLHVNTVTPGRSAQARVVVKGKNPFVIDSVNCEGMGDCFKAQLSETPNRVHVVPIAFDVPNQPGKFSELMIVKIRGRKDPIQFRVTGQIADTASASLN